MVSPFPFIGFVDLNSEDAPHAAAEARLLSELTSCDGRKRRLISVRFASRFDGAIERLLEMELATRMPIRKLIINSLNSLT
jgi:hypothetical protein